MFLKTLNEYMKSIKVIFLITCLFVILGASYLVFQNYRCAQYLKGVSDFDLQSKNGITFLKSTNKPYTGKAYSTVCGGECGFMSCSLLHWKTEYREGKLHGKFDVPLSGLGDKHWFSPGDETKTHVYENGSEIK
ncbi:hypothetical protein [sulfur-oxidizing endosymbiont of Gigantopelta aegis]|uniref:hypothetical protein n=1 Tax=sulfur-oxidizing endosymbiont of Gigantopelta aegis TaxID=2794934 RepID=UPI0018DBD7E0|nr:hypothetical protein [sulfur-oxidizing endosymbiont of Gigantopelta aegis]